ncbi:MAG: hypothetical protein R6W83_08560, partial [Cryobacterium sp.]
GRADRRCVVVCGPGRLGALAASADIALLDASAVTSQADRTPWSLEKTGQRSGNTVSWTVTATPGAPEPGALVISGQMTVVNRGSDPATIGNIVVNLQVRSGGRWITLVSNIADATSGDAATTARVMPQASSEGRDQFTESGASGELEFMDATNNTAFSLVPQILIPAGGSHTLLFQASFDNGILALPTGAQIRAETIVSFGNATAKGNSVANLDINGNGTIDADEAHVRSVPARIGLTVPVLQQGNDTVSLSDTLADIVTTGSVTFTNATFNLGATGGTVSVTYDAGADGGTITNCAYLTGTGVDLQACDTQTIPEPNTGCTPGAPGCGWEIGDMITYPQIGWDTGGIGYTTLVTYYNAVYASTFGSIELGVPGPAGFSIVFSGFAAVLDYMPASGPYAALNADLLNPTSTSSGGFGGAMLALRLNIDFADAGYIGGTSGLRFGDLRLCGLALAGLNGTSVRDFFGLANTLLGGGTNGYAIADIAPLTVELNSSFGGGGVSTFAQNHLVNGPCPGSGGWSAGDLRTYAQFDWGGDSATNSGAALLEANYGAVYGALFEVGIPGTAGFSMIFTSSASLFLYLPSSGPAGILTSDLLNPTSSPAGAFAGHLAALKLNVDFSDAGLTPRAGVAFGDVRICNVATPTGVNNMTVRQLLSSASTLLGGGSSTFTAATLAPFIESLNESFLGGVSTFAQNHLVNGPCPVGGWNVGDVLTYQQVSWANDLSAVLTLESSYSSVYAPSGVVEIGIPGTAGFSLRFSAASTIRDYLPQVTGIGPLNADLVNPTSSSSGVFGGEVLALRLNIDFSDAGVTMGNAGIAFGDLTMCGLGTTPSLDGLTVRAFSEIANTALGGGTTGHAIISLAQLTGGLNSSFGGGGVGSFARDHLVNGPCP